MALERYRWGHHRTRHILRYYEESGICMHEKNVILIKKSSYSITILVAIHGSQHRQVGVNMVLPFLEPKSICTCSLQCVPVLSISPHAQPLPPFSKSPSISPYTTSLYVQNSRSCITHLLLTPSMVLPLSFFFKRNSKPQPQRRSTSALSPPPQYSRLDPHDRLLVAHPSPPTKYCLADTLKSPRTLRSTSASEHERTSEPAATYFNHTSSPRSLRKCASCLRTLHLFEYLEHLPTATCRHDNGICLYCLHESVRLAVISIGGWDKVECPGCGERMREEEARRVVLLWEEDKGGESDR
jgi:hypothetical protein